MPFSLVDFPLQRAFVRFSPISRWAYLGQIGMDPYIILEEVADGCGSYKTAAGVAWPTSCPETLVSSGSLMDAVFVIPRPKSGGRDREDNIPTIRYPHSDSTWGPGPVDPRRSAYGPTLTMPSSKGSCGATANHASVSTFFA